MGALKATRRAIWILGLIGLFLAEAHAQTPFGETSMVRQKCSVCHKLDQQGRVEVIEETRKTPEEWKNVMERMIRINSAPISDEEFYPILKELSRHLILTPDEMAQVAYYTSEENSQYREIPKDEVEQRIFTSCVRCHAYGKVISHRMTREQWLETRLLHLGYYPTVVGQMRELDWPKESLELSEILAQRLPMDTPEWKAWMQNRQRQDLGGEWKIAGYQPGMGYYEGAYTFTADPEKGEDEYRVEKRVRYLNGMQVRTAGAGTLYGDYHLIYQLAPTPLVGRVEGVFDLDAEKGGFSGKWWTEVQDTNAFGNEMFFKADGAPRVFAVFPRSLRASGEPQTLRLVGVNLPADLQASALGFQEAGITVNRVERSDDGALAVEVTAPDGTATGPKGLTIQGVTCDEQVVVYDRLDGIRIFPSLGRARVSSGAAYPPEGVQFVARGVDFGPDGQPETPDDLILEPVDAEWWLEEEKTREDDDDLKYLQTTVLNGLYTPVTTYAPIETRRQRLGGIGLIAVGASFASDGVALKDRALLAVTVPDFIPQIK